MVFVEGKIISEVWLYAEPGDKHRRCYLEIIDRYGHTTYIPKEDQNVRPDRCLV